MTFFCFSCSGPLDLNVLKIGPQLSLSCPSVAYREKLARLILMKFETYILWLKFGTGSRATNRVMCAIYIMYIIHNPKFDHKVKLRESA